MKRWMFEPGHTAAEFCVRHMMVTDVRGHFKNVHGTLEFDPEFPALSRVRSPRPVNVTARLSSLVLACAVDIYTDWCKIPK